MPDILYSIEQKKEPYVVSGYKFPFFETKLHQVCAQRFNISSRQGFLNAPTCIYGLLKLSGQRFVGHMLLVATWLDRLGWLSWLGCLAWLGCPDWLAYLSSNCGWYYYQELHR